MKKWISAILSIILVLIVLLSVNLYLYEVDAINLKVDTTRNQNVINDTEWQFIVAVLEENRDKAQMLSNDLATNIERETRAAYPNLSILKQELDNDTPDTKFAQIVRKNFTGVYLNDIENDNNDPWAAMSWGISSDFSPNSTSRTKRTWDVEISMQANKDLAQQAISALLNMSDKELFWEFLRSDNPHHKLVTNMSLDALRDVFNSEGVEGLKTYEFLMPTYITSKGDLFGVPDVSDNGSRNSNDKIIITQGFNLYDQLVKDHESSLKYFDERRDEVNRHYNSQLITMQISIVTRSGLVFLAVLALMLIYNRLYDYSSKN